MAKPMVRQGWLSLQEAATKYHQARTSFYFWASKGLVTLRRYPVGRPRVFINEGELKALLQGQRASATEADRSALNAPSLQRLWDNPVDAFYDDFDWRTGRRVPR